MDFSQQRQLAAHAAMEAERVRRLANVPISAPVDPIEAAANCGCEVRFMSVPSLEGVYSPDPRPTIVLGSDRPAGRRSYTCAHELGHHMFKHGMRIEELSEQKQMRHKSPEEFLADAFAGFLLMSQTAVLRALKVRSWQAANLLPEQVYRLANFFGVGYSTVINHCALSLKLIPWGHANKLLEVQPRKIKAQYGAPANTEVIIVDHNWLHRTVDAEVGDTIIMPSTVEIENTRQLNHVGSKEDLLLFKAVTPGYSRAFCHESQWAVHIRVSRNKYEGLAQYRFFEESEVE